MALEVYKKNLQEKVLFKIRNYRVLIKPSLGKNSLMFIHIGKNAGTHINNISSKINSFQSKYKIISARHKGNLRDIPKRIPYFFSIRDPISRFKSAFYSRQREGFPVYNAPHNKSESKAFSIFKEANDLAESLFREDSIGEEAFWAMNSITHINTQQFDCFSSVPNFLKYRPPIYIIRTENFKNDFIKFLSKANIKVPEDELNLEKDNNSSHTTIYSDIPSLSDLARNNLKIWFKKDYFFYNICSDWLDNKFR